MTEYRFSNALGYTYAQLAEMHNLTFEGYFFPLTTTPESFADSWRIYSVDANRTIVMRDGDGAFVGLARIAVRGRRGWCAGFGVAPAFRQRGAAKALAARMTKVARETGLATLQLEVLDRNLAARSVYEGAGFAVRRQLVVVEAPVAALPEASADMAGRVEDAGLDEILPYLARGEAPAWQRELATILATGVSVGAVRGEYGHAAMLAVHRANGRALILAHAAKAATPDAALAALLRWAGQDMERVQLLTEPVDSPFLARLRALGFVEIAREYEMILAL